MSTTADETRLEPDDAAGDVEPLEDRWAGTEHQRAGGASRGYGLLLVVTGVLGAFAAGFILRRAVPAGDERLEKKLEGLGYGFLIPIFFVTSGMAIDVEAVAQAPFLLGAFFVLLILVRGLPVFVASRLERTPDGARVFDTREQLQIALYSATGLPLIVAVTGVAVAADQMSNASASILVAAGAVTVLLLPMIAGLLRRPEPVESRERA